MTRPEAPRAEITLNGKGLITELGLDRPQGVTLKGLSPHTRSLDTIDLAIQVAKAVRPEPTITIVTIPAPVEKDATSTTETLQGPDARDIVDSNENFAERGLRIARNAKRSLVAVGLGFGALGVPATVAAADQQKPSAYTVEGQMPSLNSNIIVFKDGQSLSAINSSEINYAAIEQTAQSAAERYGIAGTWSGDWHNWTIHENGAAVTLEPDPSGLAHRVRVNGAIIDGWLQVNRPGIDAVPVVVNPNGIEFMDLQAGTFRLFPKSKRNAAFNKLVVRVRRVEKTGQPGTDVMPVCVPSHKETRWVNPAQIPSAAYAAKHYGTDDDPYTKLASSWEINQYGGAHFIPDPSGLSHSLKLAGVVIDAYLNINRDGTDALAIVGAPHGPGPYDKLTVTGGTVWKPQTSADLNALNWQVWRQARDREQGPVDQGGQPGVLIIRVCN